MNDELQEAILEAICPYCGAGFGKWCVTSSGRRATWLHGDRSRPVYRGYSVGYLEAVAEAQKDPEGFLRYVQNQAPYRVG